MKAVFLIFLLLLSAPTNSANANYSKYQLDIPASSLTDALNLLSEQTNTPIIFPFRLTKNLQSPAIIGFYNMPDALTILLKNTQLKGHYSSQGVMQIQANRVFDKKLVTQAVAKESDNLAKDNDEEIEVISIHSGLRSSVNKSIHSKKNANYIVDQINALDVGKFPDANVLDSLQRIAGVQIERDELGQADKFQVRGMSQNRVEINGRTAVTGENEERSFNLSDLPSQLISELEVIKSPTADMVEGSLGATVNLNTARPFDYIKPLNVVNVTGKYGDNIEQTYGNANINLARSWNLATLGKFGILVQGTLNDNILSGDILRLKDWSNYCTSYALTQPDGKPYRIKNGEAVVEKNCAKFDKNEHTVPAQKIYAPNKLTALQFIEQRKQKSIWTTLQWAPNDTSEYLLDIGYFKKENQQQRETLNIKLQQSRNFMDVKLFDNKENGYLFNAYENLSLANSVDITDENNKIVQTVQPLQYADINSAAYVSGQGSQGESLITELFNIALQGRWSFDNASILAEISYSNSKNEKHYMVSSMQSWAGDPYTQKNETLRIADPSHAILSSGENASLDLRGSDLVSIDWQGHDLTDPRYLRLSNVQDEGWKQRPSNTSFKIDIEYDVEFGDIFSLEFGFRGNQNLMKRTERFRFRCVRNNKWGKDGPNHDSYIENEHRACTNPAISAVDLITAYPEAFNISQGFFNRANANSPGDFLTTNMDLYFTDREKWREIFGFNDEGSDVANAGYLKSPVENYTIEELTNAIYLKTNFEGVVFGSFEYRGNVGLRAVSTNITAKTHLSGQPLKTRHSYFNLLPSLNIVLMLDDSMLLRFASAKVMVRPTFEQLKPTGPFNPFADCKVYNPKDPFGLLGLPFPDPNGSDDVQAQQQALIDAIANDYSPGAICPGVKEGSGTTIGNIKLDPYTAINYDLSLEKYWGEGNLISATLFFRDVKVDLTQERQIFALPALGEELPEAVDPGTELWRVTQFKNGGKSTRQGIELAYTHFFDFLPKPFDGLGVQVNYTYSEGDRPEAVYMNELQEVVEPGTQGAKIQDVETFKPIINLSKNTVNTSIIYDQKQLNLRLSYNYRDEFYKGNNEYHDAEERLDFAMGYKVHENFTVRFNVQNILRSTSQSYIYHPSITTESGYSDIIYSLGLAMQF
ncbi:TonB-dependent receptor [Thalassotalea sp. ND16A]|uniref:TonB-dependent receptor n=1 Tax=Thalassotalea sp. ND16A TaxID=1535422 RepID=UPI00051A1CFC|nr:TonB-dependent receptor [Thalassotalea sp. ND16A]KGK00090.1 hypothetical protein ND16A_0281 [Thalassotalea sp. ND16A]